MVKRSRKSYSKKHLKGGGIAMTATDIPPTAEAAPAVDLGKVAGCTVRSPRPTPNPTLQAVLPPPGEEDWTRGPDNAYVTIIEYGDYQ